jgi:hypothetical protein
MTYTGSEYSLEALFCQLKQQVRDENVESYDQYTELVDALIEEKKSYGFLADEEDLEQIKQALKLRWSEIEQQMVH